MRKSDLRLQNPPLELEQYCTAGGQADVGGSIALEFDGLLFASEQVGGIVHTAAQLQVVESMTRNADAERGRELAEVNRYEDGLLARLAQEGVVEIGVEAVGVVVVGVHQVEECAFAQGGLGVAEADDAAIVVVDMALVVRQVGFAHRETSQ